MDKQVLKLGARILENLPDMTPQAMQGWIENPKALKEFLGGLVLSGMKLINNKSAFVYANDANPHEFFKNREGLEVTEQFRTLLMSVTSAEEHATQGEYVHYADLVKDVNDHEISRILPRGYVFMHIDTFFVHLATLIAGMGREEILSKTGSNVFTFEIDDDGYTIDIVWDDADQKWCCDIGSLYSSSWSAGDRIFSAVSFDL